MELGYCYACGERNNPEDKKCKKCGTEIINLDRSSNIVQGLRSGALSGVAVGFCCAIITALLGSGVTGSAVFGVGVFIYIFIGWFLVGVVTGAVAGVTSSLCFTKNASIIGAVVAVIGAIFIPSPHIVITILLGAAVGSTASTIERKYFRKMKWVD